MKLAYRFPMAYRWKALKCQTRPLLTHSSHSNSIQTLPQHPRSTYNTSHSHTVLQHLTRISLIAPCHHDATAQMCRDHQRESYNN